MSYVGHTGKVTGYNYDYLEKISEYTGWQMEYVVYADADANKAVSQAMEDLQNGKVDLMGPLLKNQYTEELYAFPMYSYGMVYTTLCALATGNLRETNVKSRSLLRIGLWETAKVRNAEVIAYLDAEKYNYEITYYPTAEAQQQGLQDGQVDLHAVVDSCRKIMENWAVEAGLSFETPDLAAFDPPRVRASERHLRQIFINLIGNAVKYNRPGGRVVLTAKVASRTADAVTCQFGVSDTGIGMSKAFQSRMFEPFSQEQTESPSEYRGTGLGLSIVKAMIDQMGGQITVDSRKGEGTDIVWTLTFPIDREYRETADPEAPAELDLTGKRILAAEDNALNAEIVEMMLEEAGARVTLVDNGKALVEAFAASPAGSFDYILTDVMMPVMDGYEACRAIRAMERADAAAIPIVAMTANAFSEDIRRSLDAGMNAHISKPFDVNKLKQSLAKL